MKRANSKKVVVERRFRRSTNSETGPLNEILTWKDLRQASALVILGEPGSGKTTEFEEQAQREPGATFFSIRGFRRLPVNSPRSRAEILYLDGLDEVRASGNRHEVFDEIITRLIELGHPKVRLSCRAADWFGELDRSQLLEIYPDVVMVDLQPLTEGDVEQIVQGRLLNPSAFLQVVKRQQMEDWLHNPQTLDLMIKVAEEGPLPATRSELFETACILMASEENRAHREERRGSSGAQEILKTAGSLCALALVAGLEGFASDKDESDQDFPSVEDLPYHQDEIRAAIGSRLFRWQEGRATPVHRTVAEFLGARSLRNRIREGLSLNRVVRSITGHDGGTLSDLRGLYAWLTALLPEHASDLSSQDPVALVFYGDPEPLPASVKRTIIKQLKGLSERNPWFFSEGGHLQAFGGLSDSSLIPEFREALGQPAPHHYRLTILAVLLYGPPLPALRDDLFAIVKSGAPEEHVREMAIQALAKMASDDFLSALLEDVQNGVILDEDRDLRAHLLQHLYPKIISPRTIYSYLTPPTPRWTIDSYRFFLTGGLLSQTPAEEIPDLLDGLSEGFRGVEPSQLEAWPGLVGPVLIRGLELFGGSISAPRLWSWLRLGHDDHHSILNGEHQAAVRDWLSMRPEQTTALYMWWVESKATTGSDMWDWEFWSVLCEPKFPPDLWKWQFSMAEEWTGEARGVARFRSAVVAIWRGADHPTLDEIFAWVERNPTYKKVLETLLITNLSGRFTNPEKFARLSRDREEEEARKKRVRGSLQENLDQIRAGNQDWGLNLLADYFWAPGDISRLDRIRQEFGAAIADAAVDGFIASVHRLDLPSPEDVGKLAAVNKYHFICPSLVTGIVLLRERGEIVGVSCSGVRTALAFQFTNVSHQVPRWFDSVFKDDPAASAAVIRAAWAPLLRAGAESIPYLSHRGEVIMALIGREIGLSLLMDFPQIRASLLRGLMRLALAYNRREDLVRLGLDQIACKPVKGKEQYVLWLSFLILVNPVEGVAKSKLYLKSNRLMKAYRLAENLDSLSSAEGYSFSTAPSSVLASLVVLLGSTCSPESAPHSCSGRHDPSESSRFIARLITLLGGRTDNESVYLLRSLRDERRLALWQERLSGTVEQQRRKVREERYQRPSLADTLKVLEGGEPTSVADLHAILCDHLRTLAQQIETGPESGYQTFWNIKGTGELESPIPENEARNRLRSLLQPRLAPLGIVAEIEPHYTGGNRADLKAVYRLMNVPVEIKRHYHREVWTAPRKQLKKKYSLDPEAGGFGVYLVFWFGDAEGRRLPNPPAGVTRPSTAAEMEAALRQLCSGEEWRDTEIICIDCSPRPKPVRRTRRSRS